MKNKTFISTNLFVLTVLCGFVLSSCDTESTYEPKSKSDLAKNLSAKELTLTDESGSNSIIMEISSADASLIDYYTTNHFVIIPIKEDQTFATAVEAYYAKHPSLEEGEEEEDDDSPVLGNEPSVNMIILKKNLTPGIRDVAITVIAPDFGDARADFSTVHHYSFNQETKCTIERKSLLHKVYYGLSFKEFETSAWTEIIAFQTQLNNNDPQSFHQSPCFKYDLTVRRRKSKHYTYSFSE